MLSATSFIDRFLGQFGYLAVFGFVGIESLGIPFPGETMLIAAAIYAGLTHQLNIVGVILAGASGAVIGDSIGYGIGYWGGYRLLLRYGKYIRLHQARVKLARYLFQQHGGKVVFFGRFVSVLRTYRAFLAGTARMSWPRFLAFNASGGIVWATIYGVAAYLAGDRINKLSRSLDWALVVGALVVVVALGFWLRSKESELSARAEIALPGPLEKP